MDPISNVDQIVLLLRQRLTERERAARVSSDRKAGGEPAPQPIDSLAALAAAQNVDERQLRRALIQNILADQFGVEMINDARFQQVVDKVTETIDAFPDTDRLMGRVTRELRNAGR